MRPSLAVLRGSVLVLVTVLPTIAQNPAKDAPVPDQILTSKKVFISNAGADADVIAVFKRMGQSQLPYDRFYAEMKSWGRYELVSSPADADLVFAIRFSAPISDCGNKLTQYTPQYGLSIIDAKTHFTLWSLSARVQGAFRKSTFEKNLTEGMATLMADLKQLSTGASSSAMAAK
jgi:hypothetical protein